MKILFRNISINLTQYRIQIEALLQYILSFAILNCKFRLNLKEEALYHLLFDQEFLLFLK